MDPQLLTALSDERDALRSFVELLQQEQGLLMENGVDELLLLAERKSADALRINELTDNRLLRLKKFVPEPDGIHDWLERNSAQGLEIWLEIRRLAEAAMQLNHVNGELIQMKLRYNQQSLTALTRAVNQANLYGPDGQTNFSPGSGRSLGSV